MNTKDILAASYEDLIFENRNKSYGAYDIRKKYNRHLQIAVAAAVAAFVIAVLSPYIYEKLKPKEEELVVERNVRTNELTAPPPLDEKIVEPPKIELPKIESIKFVPPKIVEHVTKKEELATVEEIKNNANISTVTQEGTKEIITEPVKEVVEEVVKKEVEPLMVAEEMPTFPGGEKAMFDFINARMKYPEIAKEMNIHGKVFVQFTVGDNGNIKDIKVLRDIGGECGKAAVDVIKQMPAWNPGKQGGKKVPVYVRIPINFQLD